MTFEDSRKCPDFRRGSQYLHVLYVAPNLLLLLINRVLPVQPSFHILVLRVPTNQQIYHMVDN